MIGSIFNSGEAGIVSPSKNPQGFNGSMWSKTSFVIAVRGMASNIPEMPHNVPKMITAIIEASALSFTFDPTILGTRKLLSMN